MALPFLDRSEELRRLRRLLNRREGSLGVLYGRRRLGKTRLLQEALKGRAAAFYLADERDSALQRQALSREASRVIPGFDRGVFPDWESLFAAFFERAPARAALAIDEFPFLVSAAPEIPGLLQKSLDLGRNRGVHVLLAGSSQRMMQGLVLDRTAPLYGRAREILRVVPIPAGWIARAIHLPPAHSVEAYAVWGGVPRYWDLACDHADTPAAVRSLALDPLGVLHHEPLRLLRDDLRETNLSSSVLSLVGQGCHRLSEIAGRMGRPATSLSRPLERLVDLDLLRRVHPFGNPPRDAKRTLYRISDPFLRFWFRFVDSNRSRLAQGEVGGVARDFEAASVDHIASVWEDLARESVPRLRLHGLEWRAAASWWGTDLRGRPVEIDVVSESAGRDALLLGEVEWSRRSNAPAMVQGLAERVPSLPFVRGRRCFFALWLREKSRAAAAEVVDPGRLLRALM